MRGWAKTTSVRLKWGRIRANTGGARVSIDGETRRRARLEEGSSKRSAAICLEQRGFSQAMIREACVLSVLLCPGGTESAGPMTTSWMVGTGGELGYS